jgi:hypothetical protein
MSTKYKNSKDVPLDVIVARLQELVGAIVSPGKFNDNEFTMRIPAECDRDADLVMSEAVNRINAMQARVAELEAREDLMCDLHYANGAKQGFSWGQVSDENALHQCVSARMSAGVSELVKLVKLRKAGGDL